MRILEINIDFENKLNKTTSIKFNKDSGFNYFSSSDHEIVLIKMFLKYLKGEDDQLIYYHNTSTPFSYLISLEDDSGLKYVYNLEFSETAKILSECLMAGGKYWGYYDHRNNSFEEGDGFGEFIFDVESESDRLFNAIHNTRKGNLFFTKAFLKLGELISRIHLDEVISSRDLKDYLNSFNKDILNRVRLIIPSLGFGIIEVTEDWRLITEYDSEGKLPIESHGSGLKSVLNILPKIISSIQLGDVTVLFPVSLSLHPLLERQLLRMYLEIHNPKKGQLIISSLHEDTYLYNDINIYKVNIKNT